MFDLRKSERIILVFLSAMLLAGLAVSTYMKFRPAQRMEISSFDHEKQAIHYRVNINTADERELAGLRGIGKTMAGRIVEHRSTSGNFASTQELMKVKGIGPALYDKIKDDVATE